MNNITIITKDRVGVVADISEIIAATDINIESIDSENIGGIAVVRMVLDQLDAALRAFNNSEFKAIAGDVILVKIEDKPGALAEIAKRFRDANLNLHSLRLVHRSGGIAIVAIACGDENRVRELVRAEII